MYGVWVGDTYERKAEATAVRLRLGSSSRLKVQAQGCSRKAKAKAQKLKAPCSCSRAWSVSKVCFLSECDSRLCDSVDILWSGLVVARGTGDWVRVRGGG